MITEKEYLHWLCHVPGLKADKMRRLMEQAGSFKDIYYMKEQELKSCQRTERHFGTEKTAGFNARGVS